jgi:hypothetical protein
MRNVEVFFEIGKRVWSVYRCLNNIQSDYKTYSTSTAYTTKNFFPLLHVPFGR